MNVFLIWVEEVAGPEVVVGLDEVLWFEPHQGHAWRFYILYFIHILLRDLDLLAS